jgi:hypothetical protein
MNFDCFHWGSKYKNGIFYFEASLEYIIFLFLIFIFAIQVIDYILENMILCIYDGSGPYKVFMKKGFTWTLTFHLKVKNTYEVVTQIPLEKF